ncbi:MAG: TVP38/TMEM64 family protein [Synergistaceae bacterium]|nr:TVP38/TMEM64 family protein [Synergistaceae bacterium]
MRKFLKPAIFIMILAVMLLLSHYYNLSGEFINSIPRIRELVNNNKFLSMIIYILAASLGCVILALPGAAFAVAAGLLFEPFTGTVLCLVAATLGAVLAFLAGRYFLRDYVRPMLEKNLTLKKFLFDDPEYNIIILLMITRLVPLFPYNLQNFAYGLTDIKILPYTLYTFIFMTPGAAVFTLGAAGVSDSERGKLYLLMAGTIAIILLIACYVLRKKFIKSH